MLKLDWTETRREVESAGSAPTGRPRAFEECYPWNLRRVPRNATIGGKAVPHPARQSGIFVVHGIGMQEREQTAAALRSGFEDALEVIEQWQEAHLKDRRPLGEHVPPPFCFDGYWSNYGKIDETFKEDWGLFCDRERRFFSDLWVQRASVLKTYVWFLRQQVGLVLDRRILAKKPAWWLLYLALQPISFVALTFALIRRPKIVSGFLADVRLYLAPRGIYEKAVVQRIDYRVGQQFLQMIGLDWDLRPLAPNERIDASGEPITFERVIWIAHSLGTVISYNVLSDLFFLAARLEREGDTEQKEGVERLRGALRRFITLGSPLDKVAFLFGTDALRPWPRGMRRDLLKGGEALEDARPTEWWVNFFHVLDPVSGSLSEPLVVGDEQPLNLHSSFVTMGLIPGMAHNAYWKDANPTLRYILGRTYGKDYLPDREFRQSSAFVRDVLPVIGYVVWAALLVGALWALVAYRSELWKAALGWAKALLPG